MPCSCAASRASAIWRAIGMAVRRKGAGSPRRGGKSVTNATVRDHLVEPAAIDELHHERSQAFDLFDAVQVGDVRVVQGRQCLRLASEAL